MRKRISINTLLKKINELSDKIDRIEKSLLPKEKKWLKFNECIPPKSACKDIHSMLDGINDFTGFIGKLSEYYGCETMGIYIDETINPKYIAEYRPLMKTAYTKGKTVNIETVLHEFFHHLCNLNVVIVNEKESEKCADEYARIFMERVNGD